MQDAFRGTLTAQQRNLLMSTAEICLQSDRLTDKQEVSRSVAVHGPVNCHR